MNIRNKALKCLVNIDFFIAGISLTALIATTFMGVIMRYYINKPITWLEEFQLWCMVWTVFFGGSAAFRSGSHVAIEFLVDFFPHVMKKIVAVLGYIVVIIILFFLMIHGLDLVKQMIDTSRYTNILHIPYSMIYSAFPIGCVLMIISYTAMIGISIFSKKADQADMKGGVQ